MVGEDPLDLGGQIAFVTGAGQRAGRAIALTLARYNAGGVAVNDFVLERATGVAGEIVALGVPPFAAPADVGDHASLRSAMKAAAVALGPISILINNAGNAGPEATIGRSLLFWETDPQEWGRYFRTNLQGVINCCHIAVPGMIAQGRGRIVTTISDAARVGEAPLVAYSVAKAAAAGFMRALARETGKFAITANAISLSTLQPPMDEPSLKQFLASDGAKAQVSRYVIRRFWLPDDVANMALSLCSDAASWITGQTYPVNGDYALAL
jgi:3-oxoacyl-[acyl-carrier protein] reductase